MTLNFDLHLEMTNRGIVVKPFTNRGIIFLNEDTGALEPGESFETTITDAREICERGTAEGLHVSFDTEATRDLLALR
jgi:hypothetical protein